MPAFGPQYQPDIDSSRWTREEQALRRQSQGPWSGKREDDATEKLEPVRSHLDIKQKKNKEKANTFTPHRQAVKRCPGRLQSPSSEAEDPAEYSFKQPGLISKLNLLRARGWMRPPAVPSNPNYCSSAIFRQQASTRSHVKASIQQEHNSKEEEDSPASKEQTTLSKTVKTNMQYFLFYYFFFSDKPAGCQKQFLQSNIALNNSRTCTITVLK